MSSPMSAPPAQKSRTSIQPCASSEGIVQRLPTTKARRKPRFKKRDGSMPFITFSSPADFTSNSTRKAVRSHVTAKQHEAARAKASVFQDPAHDQPHLAASTPPPAPVPEVVLTGPGSASTHAITLPSAVSTAADSLLQLRSSQARPVATGSDSSPSSASHVDSIVSSRSGSSTSLTPGRDVTLPGFSQMFPSETLLPPSGAGSMFRDMIDYMHRIFTPLAWPALDVSEEQGAMWEHCMAHFSEVEPALYYGRLLFAAGVLSQQGIVTDSLCSWLHRKTVTTVLDAISTPGRRNSEGTILALGHLACYETLFTEREGDKSFAVSAFVDAVGVRGGVDRLTLPESARKVLLWTDTVLAMQNRSVPLLSAVERPSEQQCLGALKLWLPDHYASISTLKLAGSR